MPREIRLKSRPEGLPAPENFELADAPARALGEGEVRVANRWLSVDPYMRGRMIDRPSYVPPFKLGEALQGGAVGEVVESRDPALRPGDMVLSMLGWREEAVAPASAFDKLPHVEGVGAQAFLGALGMPGLTAWAGLFEVGQLKDGETVFVSGAAGAVGATVCQIAKIKGCVVVGSAGGPDKVAYLKRIGVDHALDYRQGDVAGQLRAAVPKGIDLYFDNVGGEHLEAAIGAARPFARLVECGMIAGYNDDAPAPGPKNMMMVIGKRLRIQGYIVFDFQHRRDQFLADMTGWAREGRLTWEETVVDGLHAAPEAFIGLFKGANTGKMLVRL